jgi:serpin B
VISRRDTLRALAAAGVAAPALAACGAGEPNDTGGSAGDTGADPDVAAGPVRLVSADVPRSPGNAQAVPGAVSAMAAFTTDLWGRLPADGNLAVSPYSIAVALAMTANGAAGKTRQQMLDVLHIDSLATHNSGMAALTRALESLAGPVPLANGKTGEVDLASADQLFGDVLATFGRGFLTVLAKEYDAGMRTVDFRFHLEAARNAINRWTAEQTHDRIPEILPPGAVDPSTRLLLVNALYLKAPWGTPFEKVATSRKAFMRADGAPVRVPMMEADESLLTYLAGPHWRGSRLPYAGGGLAMTVALPDEGHEADVLAELMAGGLTGRGSANVTLSMPRWTFRTPTDLGQVLIDLGMPAAFDDLLSDFTPMSSDQDLYVDDVLHQAFIAVDEDGTEAAAATAVVMDLSSAVAAQQTLVLDRPFLFVIHDTTYGTPLFVGRVADPSAAGST